jgi:hypothetical protein
MNVGYNDPDDEPEPRYATCCTCGEYHVCGTCRACMRRVCRDCGPGEGRGRWCGRCGERRMANVGPWR